MVSTDASEEIDALGAKGLQHPNHQEFKEAEMIFKQLAKTDPSPTSLNNLAVCRFQQGDGEGALRVLTPNLEADLPNSFARPRGASPRSIGTQRKCRGTSPSQVADALPESWREEQEDKPISLNVKLSQAMRGVPAGEEDAE